MRSFEGLTVLLSGATGGFGTHLAKRLAADGAKLVLSDLEQEPLQTFAASLQTEVATVAGDISDESVSERLVSTAQEQFDGLDIAINNAGVAQPYVRFHLLPSEEARRVIDINLLGVFYAMKYQLPLMEKQFRKTKRSGAIVNVASYAGLKGAPRLAAYAAAKHGVIGLTKSAAVEYATKGVRVNAVCPSFSRTPMVTDQLALASGDPAAAEEHLTRVVPMQRLAEVDEVIEAILFAAHPKNSFMTGQAIAIDGGVSAV
jgi:NAD(P)-dependent dehydrogenase (short-subunit alcohol dehydrogenase family)